MDINQTWDVDLTDFRSEAESPYFPVQICADDGVQYTMYAPRAERVVALWNLFLGIPTADLKRLTRDQVQELIDRLE